MSGRERESTARRLWATPVTRSGTVTASIRSEATRSDIVTGQAERKKRDTERGGTERRRRDATSPHGVAVAGGGTTARRATATGGTNTRRAREARRAKRPARKSVQTRRTRKPWISDQLLLFLLFSSVCPTKMKKPGRHSVIDKCVLSLPSSSISILHPAVVDPHQQCRRMDGAEEVVKKGWVCPLCFTCLSINS